MKCQPILGLAAALTIGTLVSAVSIGMELPITGIGAPGPAQPTVGAAYSTIDSKVRNTCIRDPSIQNDTAGASGTHTLDLITSSQSLRHELQLSASATFGFGIYSGSFEASYFDQYQLSKYTSYLHVVVSQHTGKARLKTNDVQLARNLPDPIHSPSAFYRRCGNSVFTAASIGGHYEAILRMETDTEEQQSNLAAQLNGAALNYGGGTIQTDISNIFTSNHVKTTSQQYLTGAIVNYPNDDIASIITFAQSFPRTIHDHSSENIQDEFEILTYSQLINSIGADFGSGDQFLESLADRYEDVIKAIGSVNYMNSHLDQFSPRAAAPDNLLGRLTELANNIKGSALRCANDSTQCAGPIPNLPGDFRFPERIVWYPATGSSQADFDKFVQSSDYQPVGTVPPATVRVLEARGVWYCGGDRAQHVCPQKAAETVQYEVVDSSGAVVERGTVADGLAKITHAGQIRVRVADNYYPDNYVDIGNPVQVAVW